MEAQIETSQQPNEEEEQAQQPNEEDIIKRNEFEKTFNDDEN
jgi:hypothetical protein